MLCPSFGLGRSSGKAPSELPGPSRVQGRCVIPCAGDTPRCRPRRAWLSEGGMFSQKRCPRCAPIIPRHDRPGGGVVLFGTRTNAVGLQTCPVSTCTNAVGLQTCPVSTCTNAVGLRTCPVSTCTCAVGLQTCPGSTCTCAVGLQTRPGSTCTNAVGLRTRPMGTCTNAVGLQTCPVSTCTNAVGLQTCPVGTCPHAVGLCTDRPGLRLFRPRGLQAYWATGLGAPAEAPAVRGAARRRSRAAWACWPLGAFGPGWLGRQEADQLVWYSEDGPW